MTKPVTSLSIRIKDDGTASLSAPSWSDEGHLWAINDRPIPLADVRRVAAILGPDAVAGVEARIAATRQRLQGQVDRAQAAVDRVAAAKEALRRFDEMEAAPTA